jgi:PAS domain S-box-containing protein
MQRPFGGVDALSAQAAFAGLRSLAPFRNDLLRIAFVAAGYFLLAKSGLALASLHPSASPVWPPSGFALAALLLWGNRVWPAITGGAFLANASTFGSLSTSALIAAGNTLEALATALLLTRLAGGRRAFDTPSGVAIFAGLALVPGPMISASIGVGSLYLLGFAEAPAAANMWLTWWLGDVGGILLVTPAVTLWARPAADGAPRADWRRFALLMLAAAIVGLVAFSPLIPQTAARGALAFLAIAPLLWAALRHDQRDTATTALALCAFAVWGALAGGGPFARPDLNEAFLLVIAFIIATAVPALVLSADVAVRRVSEERHRALVEHANDIVATLDLEMRVVSVNPAVERILGYKPAEMIGKRLEGYAAEEQPTRVETLKRKLRDSGSTRYEAEVLTKDGQRRVLDVNSKLIGGDVGNAAIHVIARDVTERTDAEMRQALLVRELQHRTKNMLSVVQAVSTRTLRASASLADAESILVGRLHALGHAQDFVANGSGGGMPLRQLLEAQLSVYGSRVSFAGEEVLLGGTFAQNFALLIHELATNALKHGALRSAGGRVALDWSVGPGPQGHCLRFCWRERGGPPVAPPNREGLGILLLRSFPEALASYAAGGFEYTCCVPMEEVNGGRDVPWRELAAKD